MDVNFKFTNLFGTIYRSGNVAFSPDGFILYSPVGSKISIFDLKNGISRTLCVQSYRNIVSLAVSPHGTHLLAVNEDSHIYYINLNTETVVFSFTDGKRASTLQFSPDAKMVAVCRNNDLQIFDISKFTASSFYPFHIRSTHHIASEKLTTVDWSFDGNLVVCGGEDKSVRIVPSRKVKNFQLHSLGSHKGALVTTQFCNDLYDVISVDTRGFCQYWTCSLFPGDLIEGDYANLDISQDETSRIYYDKTKSYSVIESAGSENQSIYVTASQLHRKSSVLVTAFSNGAFVLHDVPSFSLIHNLRVSELSIHTAVFNASGDWIAIGCGKGTAAQLIVWEWQSETYITKQQAHSQRIITAQFSPDGSLLATGGEDGKVKIWNTRSAFCSVSFDEHTSIVSSVRWTQNGKVILSSSYDGTVRAHDMKRYRNFRTLVCPEPTQLADLVVDNRGDIVCASGKDVYNIYIWSLENGRLLDILSGHQANISSISLSNNKLASVGWDRSLRTWDITNVSSESVELAQEPLCVSFSPCSQVIAVLTMDSVVSLYKADDMTPLGIIECKMDLDSGRLQNDISKDNNQKARSFTTLTFSPDSTLLLLGGESNYICIYSVANRVLLRKFKLTENRSLDGVVRDLNRRNVTEFGNINQIDNIESDEDADHHRNLRLPGTRHSDLGERNMKPIMEVFSVTFCPTGRRFGVCSTEGVSLFSLDAAGIFDPFQLDTKASPQYVKNLLTLKDFTGALMASLKLNDSSFIQKVIEKAPLDSIPLVTSSLPILYAEKLLKWFVTDTAAWNSPLVNYYMIWINSILRNHGMKLKSRTDIAILTGIQQLLSHHSQFISKIADHNTYSLQYLLRIKSKQKEKVNS